MESDWEDWDNWDVTFNFVVEGVLLIMVACVGLIGNFVSFVILKSVKSFCGHLLEFYVTVTVYLQVACNYSCLYHNITIKL